MFRFFIFLLLCVFLSSCSTVAKYQIPDRPMLVVGKDDKLFSQVFKRTFVVDGKIEKIDLHVNPDNAYIRMDGTTMAGGCIVVHTPVVSIKGYIFMAPGGKSESCVGDGCSHCAFKSAGGCECKRISGICNHVIVKNWQLLRLD